jgi:hypothetical protein
VTLCQGTHTPSHCCAIRSMVPVALSRRASQESWKKLELITSFSVSHETRVSKSRGGSAGTAWLADFAAHFSPDFGYPRKLCNCIHCTERCARPNTRSRLYNPSMTNFSRVFAESSSLKVRSSANAAARLDCITKTSLNRYLYHATREGTRRPHSRCWSKSRVDVLSDRIRREIDL